MRLGFKKMVSQGLIAVMLIGTGLSMANVPGSTVHAEKTKEEIEKEKEKLEEEKKQKKDELNQLNDETEEMNKEEIIVNNQIPNPGIKVYQGSCIYLN